MTDIKKHPCFRLLQELYPTKLEKIEEERLTLCLPEVQTIKEDVIIDETFFDLHILKLHEEGWYRAPYGTTSLIIEKQDNILTLLSAPDYQPSFKKGLYRINILKKYFGVNKSFCQYNMFVLDRPLVPKYSKNDLTSLSSSGVSSAASSDLASLKSNSTVTTVINIPSKINGKTNSRTNSASSLGRPYQTKSDEPTAFRRKSRSAPEKKQSKLDSKRQYSADSGISTTWNSVNNLDREVDTPFILPPRITTYAESECYLMNLPRCDQFATHLARNLKPLIGDLKFESVKSEQKAKDIIKIFANKLHRLAQESVIAFPRSANTANNSPRFQEFLRIAIENVVVGAVHDLVFPPICYLSRKQEHELLACTDYLLRKTDFTPDQLGLSEDFCINLPAAIVELSSLDQRTTPLDRMTCIYDTVQQVMVHVRQAMLETIPNTDDFERESPGDKEMVLLLATVIVNARPKRLMSTLNYADLFAWAVPSDMIECVTLLSNAVDFVKNIQPKKLLPTSGKLKREVSMEEIIQLTDELSQSYDRHGNRLEPLKSALDLHRERFAQKLERSTADRTRRQEEAWARLDQCLPPINEQPRRKQSLLTTIHQKLICSKDGVVEV